MTRVQLMQFCSCITHAIAVMVSEKQISFELASLQVSHRGTNKRKSKTDTRTQWLLQSCNTNKPFSSPNAITPSPLSSATTAP